MRKLFFIILCICSTVIAIAQQIYGAANGLTATPATGTTRTVSLGGTVTAATTLDYTTSTTANFLIKKGTANYFFVGNNGSIGIGTNAPANKLSIAGATVTNLGLQFPGINGTTATTTLNANRVLSLDATGNVIWVNVTTNFANGITGILPVANGGTGTATTSANFVFAGPATGAVAAPAFRALGATDIPVLDMSKITTGNLDWTRIAGRPTTLTGYGITDAALATHNHSLNSLSNVNTTGLVNGDQLRWNSSNSQWERFTPTAGSSQWTTATTNIYYNTGNVGIGTTAPAYKLDVNGNARFTSSTYFQGTLNYVNGGITDLNNANARFELPGDGSVGFATGVSTSSRSMTIANTGNVGIGITNPTDKLQVIGSVGADKFSTPDFITAPNAYATTSHSLGFTKLGSLPVLWFKYNSGNTDEKTWDFYTNGSVFYGRAANDAYNAATDWLKVYRTGQTITQVEFPNGNVKASGLTLPTGAGAGKLLTSDANGNASWQTPTGGSGSSNWAADGNNIYNVNAGFVSIGTAASPAPTDADLKLAVNGNIYAQKLKVTQTGWADYVFAVDYKLPSLQEVEKYIKQHKRLPDMPSAAEVEKQGIDVGDNQALLLKKIEELTLYVIEQQKQIEELKKKVGEK